MNEQLPFEETRHCENSPIPDTRKYGIKYDAFVGDLDSEYWLGIALEIQSDFQSNEDDIMSEIGQEYLKDLGNYRQFSEHYIAILWDHRNYLQRTNLSEREKEIADIDDAVYKIKLISLKISDKIKEVRVALNLDKG